MTKIGRLAYVITSDTSQFTRGLVASSSELRRAKAIFQETRTPAERYGQEVDQLTMLLAKGAIDMDTYSRKLSGLKSAYDQVTASAKANAQATRLANANAAAPIGRMTGFGGASGTIVASGQMERATRGSNMLLGSLRGLLPVMGAIGTIRFLGSSIGEFESAQSEARKLEAVLKATGNASGRTGAQMKSQATELQRLTGISDDAITGGQALLATFKNIGPQAFDRATRAALDLSVVFKGDLHAATLQLGKALNDPIRGITSLRRAGVDFTAQQQAQIRELVAQNQLLQAQRIILAEVEGQVGGAAEATATATQKMKASWSDLKEEVGGVTQTIADLFTKPFTGAGAQGTLQMSFDGWVFALAQARELIKPTIDESVKGLTIAEATAQAQAKYNARLQERAGRQAAIHAAEQAANRAMSEREAAEAEALAKMTKRKGLMEEVAQIQIKLATMGKRDVEQRIEEAIRSGQVQRDSPLAHQLRALDRQLAVAEEAEKKRKEAASEAASKRKQEIKDEEALIKRLYEETRTPLENYRIELEKLQKLRDDEKISQDLLLRGERRLARERDEALKKQTGSDLAGKRPDATGPLRAPALERGTAAAFSASFGSAISRTAEERIARATEESRRSLQRLAAALAP